MRATTDLGARAAETELALGKFLANGYDAHFMDPAESSELRGVQFLQQQ